jgi:ABC-type transport system substrate-binding protein
MLAALVLVIAVSCGDAATATSAPQPTATPVPAAAATATPVPAAAATATPVPTGVEPSGALNVAFKEIGPYLGHPTQTGSPSKGHVTLAAFEGLTGRTVDGDFFGQVAVDWSIAPDNLTWTFNLNKGVQFHGGWGEMTSEDVIWSITEFGREGALAGFDPQIRRIFLNPEGHMKALDDYTVEVNTGTPQWDVLIWLTTPGVDGAWMVSKKQVEELVAEVGLEASISQVVGTGPWELVDHRSGDFWKFKAVKDHYRKTPFFAEMTFFEMPEESTRIANFQVGRIDTFQAAPDTIPTLAEVPGTKFMSQAGTSHTSLRLFGSWYEGVGTPDQRPGFNPDKLPYVSSNPDPASAEWERARKVREAMGIAIDREKIVEELLGGEGAPSSMWGWLGHEARELPEWKWEYDVERAKQLLKEAGYEDGFELEIAPAIRGTAAEVQTCEAVADMWADIGITARIQNVPFGTMADDIISRDEKRVVCFGTNPLLEPVLLYELGYHPDTFFSVGLDHPFLSPLVVEAYNTFDPEERWKLQAEIGDWLWDNSLDIGLYSVNNIYPLGPNVDSWEDRLETGDTRRLSALEWAPHRE